jgi:hypothetical protein
MVQFGIEPGASSDPASGPAAERQHVRCHGVRFCQILRLSVISALLLFAPLASSDPSTIDGKSRTLLVAILNIESSYLQNLERPSTATSDSVQWWIAPNEIWRIKTYAIDHDVHTHHITSLPDAPIEFATANIRKHYGDVLASIHILELRSADPEALLFAIQGAGLPPYFEFSKKGFGFWKPDQAHYFSQSEPK